MQMELTNIYNDKRLWNEIGAQIIVSVSLSDLKAFAETLIHESITRYEAERVPQHETLLYIDDVCKRLNINRSTLHRWDKIGALKAVHGVGRPRYKESDIVALSQQKRIIKK